MDESLWLATAGPRVAAPPLVGRTSAEVAVVGGGIVGVTTALLLAREGADVVLIEAGRLGAGTTGNTTAKLSSLHGLKYAELRSRQGEERARAYGLLNERGLQRVRDLAAEHSIDCDLRAKDNLTYTLEGGEVADIEEEVGVARALGLPAEFVPGGEVDLPQAVAAAVRFTGQAEFHPNKYLDGLAAACLAAGVRIHQDTRATGVKERDPCVVECERGKIEAGRVVVATHIPFLDRGLYFARTHPQRSYAIAVKVPGDLPEAMYLSTEASAHSIRSAPSPDGELLIVGGEGHKTGQADEAESYIALERFSQEHFDAGAPRYRWSSQDPVSADKMPLIGPLRPGSDRLLTATGFSKWGLAGGTEAAAILAGLCAGSEDELAHVFDPHRHRARGIAVGMPSVAKEGMDFSKRFVLDRVKRQGTTDPAPGSGAVIDRGPIKVAVYLDEEGERHELSARCTHLGCIVKWNDGDKSWDCPCHGSRFGPRGEVIEGPAVHPLRKRDEG